MARYSSSNDPGFVPELMCANCSWHEEDHDGGYLHEWQNESGYLHPERTEAEFKKLFPELVECPGFELFVED